MSNFSCKGCPDRELNCHSTCKKYRREKLDYEKRKAYIKEEEEFENYRIKSMRRTKREKR